MRINQYLSDMLEYGRSRLRIVRGWTFNTILAILSLNLLIWTRFSSEPWAGAVSIFATLSLAILGLACWFAWRSLMVSEYRKIKDNISVLPKES